MKKLSLIFMIFQFVILILSAFSCTTKEKASIDIFNDSIRAYISRSAHDPESYEPVETKVTDTVTIMENIDERITLMSGRARDYEDLIKNYNNISGSIARSLDEVKHQLEFLGRMKDSLSVSANPNATAVFIVTHNFRSNDLLDRPVQQTLRFEFTPNYRILHVYDQQGNGGFPK